MAQQPPQEPLPWEDWTERLMYSHLINMTAELIRDTTYKLKHAEKIKDKHSYSITYELGFIAAGIQERFQRMLKIYRQYADIKAFEQSKYTVPELMNAYHVMPCLSMFTVKVVTVVPDMTPFQKELTTNLFVTFENETKDYKPASIEDIMNSTRISLFNLRSYGSYAEKLVGCFFTTVTYRSAMWDLRRYFEIRHLYVNTLEFEVGYLTHEIIYRYQLVLELYQMAERRFMPLQDQNIASTSYMLYIYTNILMHSKAIMHLCNMMHELERKYKKNKEQNVFDDIFISDKKKSKSNDTQGLTEEELQKQWLEKKRKQEKKRAKERKKYYKEMMKFGFTSTKPTSPKKGPFPLIYGWSIEDW